MIIKTIYVNNILLEMDELEKTCIKKGISYLRLENEFHFLNYIYFFKDKTMMMKKERKSLQTKKENLISVKKIKNVITNKRIRKRV